MFTKTSDDRFRQKKTSIIYLKHTISVQITGLKWQYPLFQNIHFITYGYFAEEVHNASYLQLLYVMTQLTNTRPFSKNKLFEIFTILQLIHTLKQKPPLHHLLIFHIITQNKYMRVSSEPITATPHLSLSFTLTAF